MPKPSVSDVHKQIQISPGFPLPYCVPKINFTFYVLNEVQKTFQIDSLLFLSLSVFFFCGGGGGGVVSNILGYKGGGSTRQISD